MQELTLCAKFCDGAYRDIPLADKIQSSIFLYQTDIYLAKIIFNFHNFMWTWNKAYFENIFDQ